MPHPLGGRRRQDHGGHLGPESLQQSRELTEFGTEVVAPVGDAVGFVDGNEGHFASHSQSLHPFHEVRGHGFLWRDIYDFETALQSLLLHPSVHLSTPKKAGQVLAQGSADRVVEIRALIHHEGDEGRYDDGRAFAHQCGKLEAD